MHWASIQDLLIQNWQVYFLIDLPKYNKLLSSAESCTLQNFIAWLRSCMNNKNGRGPRTRPWGWPQFISAGPESEPFIETNCLQQER